MSKFSAPIRGIGFAAVVAGCLAMLTLAGRAEDTAPSGSVSIGTGTACRAPAGTVGGRENAPPDSVTTDRGGDGGQESSLRGSAAPAIDALLSGIYPPNAPGATAIVVKDGRVVLRKAYGLANVELQVPMQPESVLALASLSKQFTAAAILKLAEEGRLSVRDEITRFLPAYPTHGHTITIEHLLTHTSGLNALSETSDLRAVNVQEGKLIDVLGDWVKDLPPDAAPGERWAYSNWGYNLLGAIIEQVSGQSLWDYLRQQIFEPLGMSHTFYADRRQIIPLRATGYATQADKVFNVLPSRSRIFLPSGAGGLLSTIDDLARWDEALRGDRILNAASKAKMFTPFRLNDGTPTGYGYGWDLGDYDGHRVQEHAGGTTGFVSYMVRMPEDRVFVTILSNRPSTVLPLQTTAHRVAALALGRPIADPIAVPVAADELDRLVGTFRGTDVGAVSVTREESGLVAQVPGFEKMALVPVGQLTFRTKLVNWAFVFEAGADGRATRVRVKDWKLNDVADRITPAELRPRPVVVLDPAQLDTCAGEYESLNGVLVRVERSADHLTLTPTAQPPVDIVASSSTEFFTTDGAIQYTFVKDSRGAIAGYLRAASGATPVPARRVGTPVSRPVNLVFFSDQEAQDLRAAVERHDPRVMPAAERVRKAADLRLAQGPWSVTSARPKDTTASRHDFYSEGPYWWPDPKRPGGPYIRRDGQVNPDRFTANDNDMGSMSEVVCELGAAAWFYRDQRYADHAAKIVRTWFVDPATRMNPNLEFGQAIRGVTTGRGTGIIDSVPLVWAVQGLALLEGSGLWTGSDRNAVRQWFAEYLRWMTMSPKGLEEKKSGNNHSTWWAAQVAAYAIYVGDEATQAMAWSFYRDFLVPTQFKPNGSAPKEEARTRSLSYSAMNLNAFSLLCHLAERRGVDLWDVRTSAGVSMPQAVAYLAPFVSRPQTWRHQQITPYSPGGAYFLAVFGRGLHRPEYVDLYQKLGPHTGTWSDLLALLLLQSPKRPLIPLDVTADRR